MCKISVFPGTVAVCCLSPSSAVGVLCRAAMSGAGGRSGMLQTLEHPCTDWSSSSASRTTCPQPWEVSRPCAMAGAAAVTSWPLDQKSPRLGGHLSVSSPVSGRGSVLSHWCLCPDRPQCPCRWWVAGGSVGEQVNPMQGTLPSTEWLCLADSQWVEHI